jgi:hypothetical protein
VPVLGIWCRFLAKFGRHAMRALSCQSQLCLKLGFAGHVPGRLGRDGEPQSGCRAKTHRAKTRHRASSILQRRDAPKSEFCRGGCRLEHAVPVQLANDAYLRWCKTGIAVQAERRWNRSRAESHPVNPGSRVRMPGRDD